MKFSKAERQSFESANYYPGPGFYYNFASEPQQQVNQNQEEEQKGNWAKANRFQNEEEKNNFDKNMPAPGQYQIQGSVGKNFKSSKKLQLVKPQSLKAKSIPSIPNQGLGPGYQELGNGLLALIREPERQSQINVCPQSYDVRLSQTKKKTTGFYIKEHKSKSLLAEIEDQQKLLQQQNNSQIQQLKLQPMIAFGDNKDQQNMESFNISHFTMQSQHENQHKSSQNNKETIMNILRRNQSTSHIQKQNWNSNLDHNIELHLLRGKMLDEYANENPPPGYYFNPEQNSCMKVKSKQVEWQCFDSSSGRFPIEKVLEQPGVGEYNIDKTKSLPQFLSFKKAKREPLFSQKDGHLYPCPNTYAVDKPQTQTSKHQESEKFPTPFGSGSCRFSKKQEIIIGPGAYEVDGFAQKYNKIRQQTKKMVLLQQFQQQSDQLKENVKGANQKNEEIQAKLQLAHENYDEEFDKKSLQSMQNPSNVGGLQNQQNQQNSSSKGTSSFINKIQRFQTEFRPQTEGLIGPGSYNVQQTCQQKKSFNQQENANMNRDQRKTQLGQVQTACPKKVGPQTYSGNINAIKNKKTYEISIS